MLTITLALIKLQSFLLVEDFVSMFMKTLYLQSTISDICMPVVTEVLIIQS